MAESGGESGAGEPGMAYHPRERRSGQIDRRTFLVARPRWPRLPRAEDPRRSPRAAVTTGSSGGASASPVKLSRPDDPADAAAVRRRARDQGRAEARARHAQALQLHGVHQPRHDRRVRERERRQGRGHDVQRRWTRPSRSCRTGSTKFDLVFPTPDVPRQVVAGKLLQPLNPTLHPELRRTCGRRSQDPFYDKGVVYTVPYTSTRPASRYRTDRVAKAARRRRERLRHPLGPGVQGLRLHPRRHRESARHGAPPQRRHRRQHRGPGEAQTRRCADLKELDRRGRREDGHRGVTRAFPTAPRTVHQAGRVTP